jgi:hypothetical protein
MPFGTGAGKGDLPRPVDGSKYRDNYERIFGRNKSVEITLPNVGSDSIGGERILHPRELLDPVSSQADEGGTAGATV